MPSLFVSFSFVDRQLAEQLVAALQERGIDAWLCTEELRAGGTFDAQIQAAIATRDHGLLLLSPASAASEECHAEWRYMLSQPGHRLYVAQLVATPPQAISYRLRIYQYTDLTQDFAAGAEALAQAVLADADLDPADPTTRRNTPVSGEVPWWQAELPIVGRELQLAALTHALSTQHRVLLTGGGGVGKTRLALEAASTAAFPDGVVWFRLPAANSVGRAARDVARLTDVLRGHLHLPAGTELAAVWARLGQVRLLLVLDNAEECQYPQPYVDWLNHLETRNGTTVLVTSRLDWPALSQFQQLLLAVPARPAASQIVQQLAGRLSGQLPLAEADADAIAEAAYDNPRLLTAATPLLRTYPAAEVVARLRMLRSRPLEEATQEIINHTLELLNQQPDGPAAQAALRKLVACRGGFTLAAAQALLGSAAEELDALRAWNLLRVDGGRYVLEPLVLAVVAPEEASYPAFYTYYGELTLTLSERQQYALLAVELPNLQVAFAWALRTGRLDNAFGLIAAAGEMLHNRGLFTQELEWLEQLAAAIPADGNVRFQAELANCWGRFYLRQPLGDRRENLQAGVAAFQRALVHCPLAVDAPQYAATQGNLGAAYLRWADLEQPRHYLGLAIAALLDSAEHSSRTENPLGYATTQDNLGSTYKALAALENRAGNLELAFQAFVEAFDYRTPESAPLDYAHTLSNLGVAYIELALLEDYVENMRFAAALFQEALVYHTLELAPHAYAKAQLNLGTTQAKLGEHLDDQRELKRATEALTQALRVYTPAQYPQEYAMVQHNLGALYQQLASYDTPDQLDLLTAAIAAYNQALEFRPADTTPLLRGFTLHNLGTAHRALAAVTDQLPNLHQAQQYYEQALEFRRREIVPAAYALTQDSLGNLYRDLAAATGQPAYLASALAAFERALEVYTPTEALLDYARTRFNQASAYRDAGRLPEAAAGWQTAAALYRQHGNTAMAARSLALLRDLFYDV